MEIALALREEQEFAKGVRTGRAFGEGNFGGGALNRQLQSMESM